MGDTIFDDAVAAMRVQFSRDHMLSRPEKFNDEAQFRELEKSLGVSDNDGSSGRPTSTQDRRANASSQHGLQQPQHPSASSSYISSQHAARSKGSTGDGAARDRTSPDVGVSTDSRPSAGVNGGSGGGEESSGRDTGIYGDYAGEEVSTVPHKKIGVEQMDLKSAIWTTMEDPSSSRAAQLVAGVVMGMIILSCTAFVVQTLPQHVDSTDNAWAIIEDLCITVFTIEFSLRVATTPSKWKFITQPLNIIDLMAILPFYLELFMGNAAGSGAVIRIIRLVRIFRIFKLSRYLPWVRVFTNALALSLQPLLMLVLVIAIGMVLFSSVIYYAERGEWIAADRQWVRYNPITDEKGRSPYQSIPDSFWWCIVTMTTVGYGDVYPVTPAGRFVASVTSLSGILVVAIPVSIISTNFNSEYSKLTRQREQVKARMMLLKRHFRERKQGLDAVLDEVDDIVKRNTQEFQSELESLFNQARDELTEELQEIIRMAYERRRQLHLAALAAGRVQSSVVVTSGTGSNVGGSGGTPNPAVGAAAASASSRAGPAAAASSRREDGAQREVGGAEIELTARKAAADVGDGVGFVAGSKQYGKLSEE